MKPDAYLKSHRNLSDPLNPMVITDLEFSGEAALMAKFGCPKVVLDVSLAHRYKDKVPKSLNMLKNSFNYLLVSGAKAQTNWHRDHTGTASMYCVALGTMYVLAVRASKRNKAQFEHYEKASSRKYDQSTIV
jgi:hypothetical protein